MSIQRFSEYDDVVPVSRFTWKAWNKYEQMADENDWECFTCPVETNLFFEDTIESLKHLGVLKKGSAVRMVTIDEEYFEWAEKNNLPVNGTSLNTYLQGISAADAYRLMRKNNMDSHMTIMNVVVGDIQPIYKTDTSFILSAKARNEFVSYMEQLFGTGNVYVPGYILPAEETYFEEDRIISMAKAFFYQGQHIRYGKWEEQEISPLLTSPSAGLQIHILCIPYVVRSFWETADLSIEDYEKNETKDICPELISIESLTEDFGLTSLEGSALEKRILKCFGKNAFPVLTLAPSYGIPDLMDVLEEELMDMAE